MAAVSFTSAGASAATDAYAGPVALSMRQRVAVSVSSAHTAAPSAVSRSPSSVAEVAFLYHRHDAPLILPSSSLRLATTVRPTCGSPCVRPTTPTSSAFVTVTVTFNSAVAFSSSVAVTVTEYELLVSKSGVFLRASWPRASLGSVALPLSFKSSPLPMVKALASAPVTP